MPERDRDWQGFRIEIAGKWGAAEMARFLSDLAFLYNVRRALDGGEESRPGLLKEFLWWVRRGRYEGLPRRLDLPWRLPWGWELREEGLELVRIQHGSPGFVDLAGVGKVVEQLRLFVEKLIDLKAQRRREELENEKLREEIRAQKIANAEKFIEQARRAGVPEEELLRYLIYEVDDVQDRLHRQIEDGKVTNVTALPPPGER